MSSRKVPPPQVAPAGGQSTQQTMPMPPAMTQYNTKKRHRAAKGKEIIEEEELQPPSGESSAREIPQPPLPSRMISAEFAARVAIVASEDKEPPVEQPEPIHPVPIQSMTYGGPCDRDCGERGADREKEIVLSKEPPVSIVETTLITAVTDKESVADDNAANLPNLGLPSCTEYTTPDRDKNTLVHTSGAQYFHRNLNNEINNLQQHCREWEDYKNYFYELSENAKDMIDVAVGQANLLITKKFVQFRDLIHACENGPTSDDKSVTCADLQGFWDMIYMQVDQLNTRFGKLEEMKNNNWEEIQAAVVQKKVVQKSAPKPKMNKKPKPKAAATSSSLQAAIAAARKEQNAVAVNNETENVFNGGFFIVKSPQKSAATTPRKTPRKSQSLRRSVLSSEAHKRARRRVSTQSPGIIMKVSQSAKAVAIPGRSSV